MPCDESKQLWILRYHPTRQRHSKTSGIDGQCRDHILHSINKWLQRKIWRQRHTRQDRTDIRSKGKHKIIWQQWRQIRMVLYLQPIARRLSLKHVMIDGIYERKTGKGLEDWKTICNFAAKQSEQERWHGIANIYQYTRSLSARCHKTLSTKRGKGWRQCKATHRWCRLWSLPTTKPCVCRRACGRWANWGAHIRWR